MTETETKRNSVSKLSIVGNCNSKKAICIVRKIKVILN